jgi:hypothetical protein
MRTIKMKKMNFGPHPCLLLVVTMSYDSRGGHIMHICVLFDRFVCCDDILVCVIKNEQILIEQQQFEYIAENKRLRKILKLDLEKFRNSMVIMGRLESFSSKK